MGHPENETQAVLYSCISIGLVLLGGLMSGLTLGLMSLDSVDLEVRVTPWISACTTALALRWP